MSTAQNDGWRSLIWFVHGRAHRAQLVAHSLRGREISPSSSKTAPPEADWEQLASDSKSKGKQKSEHETLTESSRVRTAIKKSQIGQDSKQERLEERREAWQQAGKTVIQLAAEREQCTGGCSYKPVLSISETSFFGTVN